MSAARVAFPPALLYHAVGTPPTRVDREIRRLFVEPMRLNLHFAILRRRGYRSLTLGEYLDGMRRGGVGERRFLLTFDDGFAHLNGVVTPILMQHGFTAVVFVPAAHVAGVNSWDHSHRGFVLQIANARQLKTMSDGPWDVASHGWDHVDLTSCDREDRRRRLVNARETLEQITGLAVRALAYPYGAHDAATRDDARWAGYEAAFAATTGHDAGQYSLPRRPVRGGDSRLMFELKMSAAAELAYPAWRRLVRREPSTPEMGMFR
jgi:peptidoglycan/xylan/chitin deacetylase (PgdA/CDA1 family)